MHIHIRAADPSYPKTMSGTRWLSQARQAILEWEGVPEGICHRELKREPKLRRTSVG